MMLNKTMIWIFSTKTLRAMIGDLNFHFAEIKDDPSPALLSHTRPSARRSSI
ncbi:MAG TPA: hypothetical protein VGU90_08480 [Terriglobales bacterium]|jgi:hypothetical protein|nr:hypothetical protein [Terriglobales bacterium]